MLTGKLNPTPTARLNFPGFQEILDFTSAGSESTVSVPVVGDTDKEYRVDCRQLNNSVGIALHLNSDTGSNYGYQYLGNNNGTISAARSTSTRILVGWTEYSINSLSLLTPTGLLKTGYAAHQRWTSGTTVYSYWNWGWSWNSTANVTSLTFSPETGNFTSGTRITVYARRSV